MISARMLSLDEYLEQRWALLGDRAKKVLGDDAEVRVFLAALWEKQYYKEKYEHLEQKVQHGCTNGFCKICDPEAYKILSGKRVRGSQKKKGHK